MPRPISTDVRNALKSRQISSAWLFEMFCDEGVLRAWDRRKPVTFESHSIEALSDQIKISGDVQLGNELVPEPLTIEIDAAKALDSDTFIGRFVDRTWYQRRIRVRQLLLVPMSNGTIIDPFYDWYGYMDNIDDLSGDGTPSKIILTCEGGIFRALGRNMRTYTDVDQRQIDPDDPSFVNTATKPFQSIPFGESWTNVPGYQAAAGSSSSGSSNFNAAKYSSLGRS